MSKIVQAVNAMISRPDLITRVARGADDEEIFFEYKSKYKWSMVQRDDEHWLWYYPGQGGSLEDLASLNGPEFENVDLVTYKDSEIGTREATASFSELYSVLKERIYGMNEVLDDIIGDASA